MYLFVEAKKKLAMLWDKGLLGGVFLTMTLAFGGRYLHGYFPEIIKSLIGDVVFVFVLGLVVGNASSINSYLIKGIRFCSDLPLKFAIILLGFKISLTDILNLGLPSLLSISVIMLVAFATSNYLGRLVGLSPKLATLIGVGTAICGNTAITATSPAIGARDEEMSFAIATNTFFGTLAVFLYPFIAQAFEMSHTSFGLWAGLAINDTSQVMAASFGFSEAAGDIATTVKMTRNSLMGIAIIFVSSIHFQTQPQSQGGKLELLKRLRIPSFILIFLLIACLNSTGFFDMAIGASYPMIKLFLCDSVKIFMLVALTAVGMKTNVRAFGKIGWPPFIVGISVAVTCSILALVFIKLGIYE